MPNKKSPANKKPVSKKPAKTAAKRKTVPAKRSVTSKPKSNKLHHRVKHHINKHVMKYLGGGAALFLLTFASVQGASFAAAKQDTIVKNKNGYLVVYGKGYKKAQITAFGGAADGKHKCGVLLTSKNNYTAKKTVSKNPSRVTCAATGGDGGYRVSYAVSDKFTKTVSVDVDENYCTHVFADASKIAKTPVKNGKCEDLKSQDNFQKLVTTTRSLPVLSSNKKRITGYGEVSAADDIPKTFCTGQVTVKFSTDNRVALSKNLPLKYTKPKNGKGYCVAKISDNGKLRPGKYTVQVYYNGSDFLQSSAAGAEVTIPQPAKKK